MTIEQLKIQISPILKKHGVIRAGVFGSVARGDAKEDSLEWQTPKQKHSL